MLGGGRIVEFFPCFFSHGAGNAFSIFSKIHPDRKEGSRKMLRAERRENQWSLQSIEKRF